MATKRQVLKRCEELGVEFIDDGESVSINAPTGHTFAGTDLHWHEYYPGDFRNGWTRADVYGEFMDLMIDGLWVCGDLCPCREDGMDEDK